MKLAEESRTFGGISPFGLQIGNPKRSVLALKQSRGENFYPYYAGFSESFAYNLLHSLKRRKELVVLDPWNGSGTVTSAATNLGVASVGIDINPVMVIIAKARLLSRYDIDSMLPLAAHILEESRIIKIPDCSGSLLRNWYDLATSKRVRKVGSAINKILTTEEYQNADFEIHNASCISSIAAFFYVALFRTVRSYLDGFKTTNPTWIKSAKDETNHISIRRDNFENCFLKQVSSLLSVIPSRWQDSELFESRILLGNSSLIDLPDQSIDIVLTSPPYCTRIDYAVATSPELATLGMTQSQYAAFRVEFMGTATNATATPTPIPEWGKSCIDFIKLVESHASKASSGYYYKNHCQYFGGLFKSISEINRVIKKKGTCCMVVQDSFYKNIHNDLPKIVVEMGSEFDLHFRQEMEFPSNRSMVSRNSRATKYVSNRTVTEKVIVLQREGV
jgi:DNA modification methylase